MRQAVKIHRGGVTLWCGHSSDVSTYTRHKQLQRELEALDGLILNCVHRKAEVAGILHELEKAEEALRRM